MESELKTCWICEGIFTPAAIDPDGIYICEYCEPQEPKAAAKEISFANTSRVAVFTSPDELWWLIAHPSIECQGKIQLTSFDEHGPVGHTTWQDMTAAAGAVMGRWAGLEPPVGNYSFRLIEVRC